MANDFDESSANEEASKGLSWWYSADVLSRDKSDKTAKRIRRISITDRLLRHPGRLSMVYFGALIIIVTGLLLLPISTSDIIFTNFPIAFFTAVSALSTCGIPVVNTGEYWSMFGQVVVLFSIQFGGLGVMTFASMVALGVSRRLKVSQRMLTANELGTTKLSEVKGVLTVVLGTSIIAEVLTFVLLLPDLFRVNHGNMGRTLWQALFYAVSAYNNTGFTPDATGLHVNRWGRGAADSHQCIHWNARLPRGAESGAVRTPAAQPETLDIAHQTHFGDHRCAGGHLTGLVPAGRVEQYRPVPRR